VDVVNIRRMVEFLSFFGVTCFGVTCCMSAALGQISCPRAANRALDAGRRRLVFGRVLG
jgi:hypothetical protein